MSRSPSVHDLEVDVSREGTAVVLRVAGEIDLATAPRLTAAIGLATASARGGTVAVDMSGVELIDSTGLRTLLDAARQDENLVVLRPSREVRRILELTLLAATIPVVEDLEDVA